MEKPEDVLHPMVVRTLSWFASSSRGSNSSSSNSSDWHISNWFHNNTFDYEEFNEDVQDVTSDLEDNLHPASDVDVNGVLSSTIFNAFVFVALMTTYELLRRYFPYVYATRQSRQAVYDSRAKRESFSGSGMPPPLQTRRQSSTENLPDLYQSNAPLEWVKPVFGISWRQVREEAGLDAYFFLRYIRMCFRITSVSAFWGLVILFPIFANGKNDAAGWYHFSMANVQQGSRLIWVPTLFMYLFSSFVFFIMKHEYKHFVELRLDFLGKGGGGSDPQHHYSVMVEDIPPELRSEKALFDYFDKMFPGRVHSSNVFLKLPEVLELSKKKLRVTQRLEKSIAHYEATGTRPDHVVGRPRIMLCGIELNTMDCICCDSKKQLIVDFDEVEADEVDKGQRVDSINYYTHQLKSLNKKMFLLQKKKRDVAEFGNNTLMAASWYTMVSEYAEYFMDDPNVEDSDEDELLGFVDDITPLEERELQIGENGPMGSVHRQTSEVTMGTEFMGMDGETDTSRQESHPQTKTWIIPDGIDQSATSLPTSPKAEGKWSSTCNSLTGPLSPSTLYGTVESHTPGTDSKKRRKFFRTLKSKKQSNFDEDGSSSSREEPLISHPSSQILEASLQHGGILRNRRRIGATNSGTNFSRGQLNGPVASCMPSDKTAKRLSKLAGRFGLDYGIYAMKLFHRYLNRTLDDDKENAMSKTGFVTFLDLGAVTCVASAPLTHKPSTLQINVAPEARDLVFQNCHYSSRLTNRRQTNANNVLVIGALIWSIPVAFIQGVSSAENVAQLPGMEWILEYDNGSLKGFINAYLPVVGLLGLILILPLVFEWVGTSYEKRKTRSDIQRSIVGRYFYYQLANIYISVTAGSLLKSAADILARPSAGLEILGNSLPTVVGYFIALIITKILGGLPLVILRLGALSRYLLLRLITREPFLTQRELDQVYRAEPLLYGWEYPTQLLVIVICFTYACISPIILIVGACYFIGALMVYKKQVLYVYSPSYESGGSLFPLVCDRTIVGLICGQLTFIGYSIIRGGHYQVSFKTCNLSLILHAQITKTVQPLALVPLVFFSLWTMNYFRTNFAEPSKRLTLERAMELDEHTTRVERTASPLRRRRKGIAIPQDSFSREHYKQPVLTEKHNVPRFYRVGETDALTVEAREKLSDGIRADLWFSDREGDSERRQREDGMTV